MKRETEDVYKLVKKYGGVLSNDRHFMDDVDQLLETAHNSDYAKCPKCGAGRGHIIVQAGCVVCEHEW